MKTFLDCVPCFCAQTLESVRRVTDDEAVHEEVLRDVLRHIHQMDMSESPPRMAQRIHGIVREHTRVEDPYREDKRQFNQLALEMYPEMARLVEESDDPLEMAVKLAIAGNVIDMGMKSQMKAADIPAEIATTLEAPFEGDVADLQEAMAGATDILYLADNAGEIVFDKLFLNLMPLTKVAVVVRGFPILNDATREDALETGIPRLAEVIDNGSSAPGTILSDCSANFQARFDKADLVIAKGQGNYETLSNVDKEIVFLLKAKCPMIARDLGCPVGTMVLRHTDKPYVGERCEEKAILVENK